MGNPKVFISYSHSEEEANWIREFARALEEQGVSVWLDVERLTAGDRIQEELEQALRGSDALVAVVDPRRPTRPDLLFELGAALGMGKRVIPIVPSDSDMPPLPHSLRSRQSLTRRSPEETARSVALAVSERTPG